ncbi:MAG: septal ring lytic transglycosylase RlpA family protein [Methylosarcina sp.]
MNKIIPSISVILLCGCSTQQIRTPDVSINKIAPPPRLTAETSQNQTTTPSISSTLPASAKRHLIADRSFRQHTVLQVNRSNKLEEPPQQEALIPRITRYIKQGIASWYGPRFHGKKTATGEIFDMYAMTAAHKTLPIPSYAQVTNLENNRSVIVRINDRGPYVGNRLLDLSYAAAKKLGIQKEGLAKVEIVALTKDQALPQLQNNKEEK